MGEDVPPHQQHPYTTKTCIINTTIVMSSLAMLQQLIIGLVLVLAIAHAKVNMVHSDVVLKPRGNWSMDPRASGTVSCARRPRSVILNSGDVATFRSPGYPSRYPSRSYCGWRFKTSAPSGITVTCSSFRLQPTHQGYCRDYLAIGRNNHTIGKNRYYCGRRGPSRVKVGNSLTMGFRSDRTWNYPGFSCTATVEGSTATERCVCGVVNRSTRIVGGNTTEVNEYPWQVALTTRSGVLICGGSLINDRWVLTAAGCTQAGVYQVELGNPHRHSMDDSAAMRFKVKRVVDHPNYNSPTPLNNDFSLLELTYPVDLEMVSPSIRPICLPSTSNSSQYENVDAVITGWGSTTESGFNSDALQEATVRTMSNDKCQRSFGNIKIHSAMICASNPGRGPCKGDAGGPMVTNVANYLNLIGVISWGIGCAHPSKPGVYARVTEELNWIKETSSSGTSCAPPS